MKYILLLFLLFFDDPWIIKIEKNGITVSVKQIEGQEIKSVRSFVTINAPIEKVKSIILDIDNYPSWVYKCSKAHLLKSTSPNELIYYQYTNAPITIKDRDLVVGMYIQNENDGWTIDLKALPDYIPQNKNVIRINLFNSTWRLVRKGNKTEVTNEITTDPGGSVPSRVINSLITDGPYNTSLNLKKLAEGN
jgi:hypothetical protein